MSARITPSHYRAQHRAAERIAVRVLRSLRLAHALTRVPTLWAAAACGVRR